MSSFDPTSLILMGLGALITMWAQFKLKSTFNKYSKIQNSRGMTGETAARLLLKASNINNVPVNAVQGNLSDHYASGNEKRIGLSEPVYGRTTIAAIGVA